MISETKDRALCHNFQEYYQILEWQPYLRPKNVHFCTRMKKMNWSFRLFHTKRAKRWYCFSNFIEHIVKINILYNNLYWNCKVLYESLLTTLSRDILPYYIWFWKRLLQYLWEIFFSSSSIDCIQWISPKFNFSNKRFNTFHDVCV